MSKKDPQLVHSIEGNYANFIAIQGSWCIKGICYMKQTSPIIKVILCMALITNIPLHSIMIVWSDFTPSWHDVLSTIVMAAIPATATCLIKYFCCTRPARQRVRRLAGELDPASLIRRVKRTIINKIDKENPTTSLFRDFDNPDPSITTPCDNLFAIGSGEILGTFMATLSPENIEILKRAKGVILVCGDFEHFAGRRDTRPYKIDRNNLRSATDIFIAHQIPFLIIHIQEHVNRSRREGMIGAPSFTVSSVSIPHISHHSLHPLPKIMGTDALSVNGIMNNIRDHLKREANFFLAKTEEQYPSERLAKSYRDVFLRHLNDNGPSPREDSESDGDSS